MDLLCVAFRGRQVQLMGNWTDKSSRPKNERRPPTQTPPISPPFFSSSPAPLDGLKNLILLRTKITQHRAHIYTTTSWVPSNHLYRS